MLLHSIQCGGVVAEIFPTFCGPTYPIVLRVLFIKFDLTSMALQVLLNNLGFFRSITKIILLN